MPDFAYRARNPGGQQIAGVIAAASPREALAALAEQSLFALELRASDRPAFDWRRWLKQRQRVNTATLATLLGQMGDLLASGVPLLRALDVLSRQTSHAKLGEVLGELKQQVSDGVSFETALARYPRVFSELTVSLVRAGIEGNFLEDVLQRASGFLEQQEELKGRVTGALIYPAVLLSAGFTALTLIIIFIVPMFGELFARLAADGGLPLPTRLLLASSGVIREHLLWIVLGVIGLALAARKAWASDAVQRAWDRWRIKLPLLGPILLSFAVARFCRVLGTLLKNGVPILRSLEIASGATGNRVLAQAVLDAGANIAKGQSLSRPLAASGLFPGEVLEMVAVAEEANNLDSVLVQIADSLERRTSRKLDLFVRLLEPLLLLVMASAVLFVVVSLLLPVIDAATKIG